MSFACGNSWSISFLFRTLGILLLLALSRSVGPAFPLAEAYVWQFRWTPALTRAIAQNADFIEAWHVLAAEGSAGGIFHPTNADWTELAATHRRLIPVLRIDGRIDDSNEKNLVARVDAVWRALPPAAHGALEIDHDSATARLADYAKFLNALRQNLPSGTHLQITALPTWLSAPAFLQVAGSMDSIVLQVHAIEDPRLGLFDAGRAARWVRRFVAQTDVSFVVSVPAYGVKILSGPSGGLLAAAAENTDLDAVQGDEEMAAPADVAIFLDWLRARNFASLRGIVWFRLPTTDDRRAWSAATLRTVSAGIALHPHIGLSSTPGWQTGLRDLSLINDGDSDAILPGAVALPPGCSMAEGSGNYDFDGVQLVRHRYGMLHVGQRLRIGWQRCPDTPHGAQ